jgi:hypothetical protein
MVGGGIDMDMKVELEMGLSWKPAWLYATSTRLCLEHVIPPCTQCTSQYDVAPRVLQVGMFILELI